MRTRLLGGVAAARLRIAAGRKPVAQHRQPVAERMGNVHHHLPAPVELLQSAGVGLRSLLEHPVERRQQQCVETLIGFRQPALRTLGQHVFEEHRAGEPLVAFPLIA